MRNREFFLLHVFGLFFAGFVILQFVPKAQESKNSDVAIVSECFHLQRENTQLVAVVGVAKQIIEAQDAEIAGLKAELKKVSPRLASN